MKRCSSPDHPHCTLWVAPGAAACAHGHAQAESEAASEAATEVRADPIGPSFSLLQEARARRAELATTVAAPAVRPHLRVSGFDPRAAGGRQAIRLELRGLPNDVPSEITLLLQSDLLPDGGGLQRVARARDGAWRPLIVEFSSRGREHGQYRVDLELHARLPHGRPEQARTWVATLLLLVPRPDASLSEIHQTFLSMHKNVRISADDASIARVHGLDAAGPLDLDIGVRNASIAQIHLGNLGNGAAGARTDLALPTIAWDEDLIEIDRAEGRMAHPCPASSACLVYAQPDAGFPRHLRLFALDECVLGRFEADDAEADLLLMHHDDADGGAQLGGLTRRLSARHAVIRPARGGFEIEDVSRYGVALDGVWPGKNVPTALRLGMRIEFTASIKGIVTLVVTALLPHAVVLHRVDAGGAAECFMLCAPEAKSAGESPAAALPRAAALPLLFHRDGGFWHRDPASGTETPLGPATALDRLAGVTAGSRGLVRFTATARPEDRPACAEERVDARRRATGARMLDA